MTNVYLEPPGEVPNAHLDTPWRCPAPTWSPPGARGQEDPVPAVGVGAPAHLYPQAMEAPLEAPEDDEDEDEDEEQVAEAQERLLQALMARTARELPQRELEQDWAVLGELGSGSYGRVLLAEPRDGGARVALKLLSKERTARCGFLREFCTHLCLRGALTCVQVLPLAFETPTEFGFAQELAPAGDLCGLLTPGAMEAPLEAPEDDEDEDEDEEQVAEAQERLLQALMARTARELPQRELEQDWAVLGELGSGSYGRVLLAEPRDGGARVALKLLSKERTARCGFLREFCTHLCLRGGLTCVQVLPLAFETPTEFGFAQELAPAGDLCGLLTPGVGLPEPQVKRCAAQVSSALSYLHGHALVHRDLKLDNVLAFDRECHLVKLGDFGLTRVLGWQVRPARSPAPYAAPELWHLRAGEARLRLEPALDTWAFGVLLFALLTGRFPWSSPARSDPAFRRFRTWHGRTCAGHGGSPGGPRG
ncbi:uncharacterized serine/threonine-protein kinase SBK3-like [Catharus ustulatus]|uniref:uncharacterized serine/threonine-protein kinase SBK3-like n=1 Tax=Catharus ustulatus TaxID=91951 RepID=UPI00140E5676|nr:uncharacterized serine/threonine-protein kinase SBK3-like [Catharus ustulatus]